MRTVRLVRASYSTQRDDGSSPARYPHRVPLSSRQLADVNAPGKVIVVSGFCLPGSHFVRCRLSPCSSHIPSPHPACAAAENGIAKGAPSVCPGTQLRTNDGPNSSNCIGSSVPEIAVTSDSDGSDGSATSCHPKRAGIPSPPALCGSARCPRRATK